MVLVCTVLPAFCGELQPIPDVKSPTGKDKKCVLQIEKNGIKHKQNPVNLQKSHTKGAPMMEKVPSVSPEMEVELLQKLQGNQPVEQKWLYAALGAQQTTLRAYAATALGKAGDKRAIPYLIQALCDQSMHVGANYAEPGMATTRYRANQSLKTLAGKDFGFIWNAPESDRKQAIQKWIAWYDQI